MPNENKIVIDYILSKKNDKNIINKNTDMYVDQSQIKKLSDHAIKLVTINYNPPKEAVKFIKVPHIKNGFENSCSEASAEGVLRFWGVVDWNQFRIHMEGYMTFESSISEGDKGILNLFKHMEFKDEHNNVIKFEVIEKNNSTFEDMLKFIDQDIPVIVRITTNENKTDYHTEVLIGYNNKGVFLNDNDVYNRIGKVKYIFKDNKQFLEGWTGNFIAIYPKK